MSKIKYSLKFTDTGRAQWKELPKNVRNYLKKKIPPLLEFDPIAASEPLLPPLDILRSCHIEKYRVAIYVAEDIHAVAIVGVGKHDAKNDIYKRLEALMTHGHLAEKLLNVLRSFGHRPSDS